MIFVRIESDVEVEKKVIFSLTREGAVEDSNCLAALNFKRDFYGVALAKN